MVRAFLGKTVRNVVRCTGQYMVRRAGYCADPRKVLAFTGHDVDYLTSRPAFFSGKSIWHYITKNYSLLALDTGAVDFCLDLNVPPLLPSELIDEIELLKEFDCADDKWKRLTKACLPLVEAGGICWLSQDSEALHWFRNEIPYISVLAKALRSSGVTNLAFVQSAVPLPATYYYRSTTWQTLFCQLLSDIAESVTLHSSPAIGFAGLESQYPILERPLGGSVLFVIGVSELARFHNIIVRITTEFPNSYAVILTGGTEERAMRLQQELAVPVFLAPAIHMVRDDTAFPGFIDTVHAIFQDEVKAVSATLKYYASVRWPSLGRWADWWSAAMRENRIAAVIGSSLDDLEIQIPFLIAKKLNIPTISLPHGVLFAPTQREDEYAVDFFLSPTRVQEKTLQELFPQTRFITTPLVALDMEYPTFRKESNDRMTVVVIVGTSLLAGGPIVPYFSQRKQIDALKAFSALEEDDEEGIRVCFKMHPGFPETSLFRLAGVTESQVLPADTDLFSFTPEKTVFVLLNYLGVPAFHALSLGIPVVIVKNSETLGHGLTAKLQNFFPAFEDINGPFFSDLSDAVNSTRKLCCEHGYRMEILERQKYCHAKYFSTDEEGMEILSKILMPRGEAALGTFLL